MIGVLDLASRPRLIIGGRWLVEISSPFSSTPIFLPIFTTRALVSSSSVHTDHGKPEKSWNSIISCSRPGKSWNLGVGHGKSWKISTLSMSERQ